MSENEVVSKIVELRQSGLTWQQVEEILFPETWQPKGPAVWKLANKHKTNGAAGAFTKRVYGAFTPTQVVEKLRPRIVPLVPTIPTTVEMFI